jgi:hypothetical protein
MLRCWLIAAILVWVTASFGGTATAEPAVEDAVVSAAAGCARSAETADLEALATRLGLTAGPTQTIESPVPEIPGSRPGATMHARERLWRQGRAGPAVLRWYDVSPQLIAAGVEPIGFRGCIVQGPVRDAGALVEAVTEASGLAPLRFDAISPTRAVIPLSTHVHVDLWFADPLPLPPGPVNPDDLQAAVRRAIEGRPAQARVTNMRASNERPAPPPPPEAAELIGRAAAGCAAAGSVGDVERLVARLGLRADAVQRGAGSLPVAARWRSEDGHVTLVLLETETGAACVVAGISTDAADLTRAVARASGFSVELALQPGARRVAVIFAPGVATLADTTPTFELELAEPMRRRQAGERIAVQDLRGRAAIFSVQHTVSARGD